MMVGTRRSGANAGPNLTAGLTDMLLDNHDLPPAERCIAATRAWVDHAVIGLNLCPFARAAQARGQVRYTVCGAADAEAVLAALVDELRTLVAADPAQTETTLLILPQALADFLDFNDFLDVADEAVEALGLTGVIQVASFHPHYRFEGSEDDDVANASNRSPWPTLHLLREASVERAVQAYPEAEAIFENNIETLERLGADGWRALQGQWQ